VIESGVEQRVDEMFAVFVASDQEGILPSNEKLSPDY